MIIPWTALEATGTAIATFLGAAKAISHMAHKSKAKRESYSQEILDQAKTEMEKIEQDLEVKIKRLEIELEAQKLSVSKEFSYFKQAHNTEIKALAEKIESLRQDISQQHQALVGLLTKLVNTK